MRVYPDSVLNFYSVELLTEPFDYFISPKGFSDEVSLSMLEWLETAAPWRLVETDFYEQFEFSFLDVELPSHLSFLQNGAFLHALTKKVERCFNFNISGQMDITAHKLIQGQRIRIHNDFIPGQKTHRVLIQLNRNWNDSNGGFLLFFNSPNPADVHRVFRPVHNSVVGFSISPRSNHAVSTIHGGERFTLVCSFYGKGDDA